MYSGTTIIAMKPFDAWFGAHQKIDRVARRHLQTLLLDKNTYFPTNHQISGFEGRNGPDGIKVKTPAKDEPWHYYNPADPADTKIIAIIEDHHRDLTKALRDRNQARAAFEAAWMAHAIVDGLTPAHHYPYEEELFKLRGEGKETRITIKDKLVLPGDNIPQKIQNNWKFWGDKGLLATHFAFEWGIAIMATPLRLGKSQPSDAELKEVMEQGIGPVFLRIAAEIASLDMYAQFYRSGWTPKLGKIARTELLPRIVTAVTLAWYAAATEANKVKK